MGRRQRAGKGRAFHREGSDRRGGGRGLSPCDIQRQDHVCERCARPRDPYDAPTGHGSQPRHAIEARNVRARPRLLRAGPGNPDRPARGDPERADRQDGVCPAGSQ